MEGKQLSGNQTHQIYRKKYIIFDRIVSESLKAVTCLEMHFDILLVYNSG